MQKWEYCTILRNEEFGEIGIYIIYPDGLMNKVDDFIEKKGKRITFNTKEGGDKFEVDFWGYHATKVLNDLGEDGWELVTTPFINYYILKRPKI